MVFGFRKTATALVKPDKLLLLLLLLLYEATVNTSAFILESLPSKKVLCLGRYSQHYTQYAYVHLFPQ